jgi:hypothetical protein
VWSSVTRWPRSFFKTSSCLECLPTITSPEIDSRCVLTCTWPCLGIPPPAPETRTPSMPPQSCPHAHHDDFALHATCTGQRSTKTVDGYSSATIPLRSGGHTVVVVVCFRPGSGTMHAAVPLGAPRRPRKKNSEVPLASHASTCHPCAGAMLIVTVTFQVSLQVATPSCEVCNHGHLVDVCEASRLGFGWALALLGIVWHLFMLSTKPLSGCAHSPDTPIMHAP